MILENAMMILSFIEQIASIMGSVATVIGVIIALKRG